MSLGLGLLVALMIGATVTDVRAGRIPNAITYPGMLIGLIGSALTVLPVADLVRSIWGLGMPTPLEAIAGWAACGGLMVVCYALFAGQVGGGDVKLLAMVGAFLGPYGGLETLLWTFVIGAAAALIRLIWQVGIGTILSRGARYVTASLRVGRPMEIDARDREPLKTPLYLAPCALVALLWFEFLMPDRWR